jgi:peptidyl-prolyl cis-trans isomerase SurA
MQKIFLRLTGVLLFIGFINTCFAQPTGLVADKIIAVVGNKVVLKSDVDNAILDMKRQGADIPADAACYLLEQAISIKALVLQAEIDSIPVSDEDIDADIDNRIRYFINQYGSKEEVEKIAGKSIYQLKEDFKENIKEQKLAGSMRNKIVENITITPNEVHAFFKSIPTDSLPFYESEIELGQIVAFPKASRDAEEYCIEQLREYKNQIESGKKDFATIAAVYSEDPGSRERGGQYEINRNQKDLDPVWLSKAFTLKEGQISNPFKTRFGYHIIQLVSRSGDDAIVRHILKIPQVTQFEVALTTKKLDSVWAKLVAGTIDFGTAVSKYSDDECSKFTGGMIQGKSGSLLTIDELDKEVVVQLKKLSSGEYAQPFEFTDERGKKGVKIIYLKSKSEPHRENLKDDYNKLSLRALENKKSIAVEKWFGEKTANYYISIDPEYEDCAGLAYWLGIARKAKK